MYFAILLNAVTAGRHCVTSTRSRHVRLGVLLAMRRHGDACVALFLNDPDEAIVKECARAIHDTEIGAALPALAQTLAAASIASDDRTISAPGDTASLSEDGANWHLRRLINANLRLGDADAAARVARFAASPLGDFDSRQFALDALEEWTEPDPLDKVVGYYRQRPKRDRAIGAAAVDGVVLRLLRDPSGSIQSKAAKLASNYGLRLEPKVFLDLLANEDAQVAARTEALRYVVQSGSQHARTAIDTAWASSDEMLRRAGLRQLALLDPTSAIPRLETTLRNGGLRDKQAALETLGGLDREIAAGLMRTWAKKLALGTAPPELELDILLAAQGRLGNDAEVRGSLQAFQTALQQRKSGPRSMALAGGGRDRGREVFFNNSATQCSRCHRAGGKAGSEVGPDLTGIGAKRDRTYLLESLLDPNAKIAEGFETTVLQLSNGTTQQGILRSETEESVILELPLDLSTSSTEPDQANRITVRKADIEARRKGISGMPEHLVKSLSDRELRDLLEYLATNSKDAP